MDPQKNPASVPPLNPEDANADTPAAPVAGQMIEPQTPNPAGMPSPSSNEPLFPTPDTPAGAWPANPPKRRKKGLVIGLIVAAVVLLLSGGAAAAYYYVASKPENVLKQALANTFDPAKTKTVQLSGAFTVDTADSDMDVTGSFNGTTDLQSGALDVSTEIDAFVTKLTLDVRSTDGKSLYLKVGGLDGLSALLGGMAGITDESAAADLYGPYLDSLNDQWYEINQSMLDQIAGDGASDRELTETGRKKLAEAYGQNQFLVVKQKLPDQAIKNVNSYHYKVGVDKAKFKSFAVALKNSGVEELKITDDQLKELNKAVDEANLDAFSFEIWIAKGDKTIRQLSFNFTDEDGAKVTVRLTVDSYNKPVEVEKPADAKSLLELIGGFFGGGLESGSDLSELEQEFQTGISL